MEIPAKSMQYIFPQHFWMVFVLKS